MIWRSPGDVEFLGLFFMNIFTINNIEYYIAGMYNDSACIFAFVGKLICNLFGHIRTICRNAKRKKYRGFCELNCIINSLSEP